MSTVLITPASRTLSRLVPLVAIALTHAYSASASACSCAPPHAFLVWPPPAAQEVSIEPDIVVQVPLSRLHGATQVRLVGPDGAALELTERRREIQNSNISCANETVFLAPLAPLAPNTRYTMAFEGNFDAGTGEQVAEREFTTGRGVVAAPEPTQVSLQFNRLIQGPDCSSRATPSCPDLADLQVTQTAREGAPPTWLRITTQGAAPYDDWFETLPGAVSAGLRRSLALASSDDCVAYERIDVSGQTIAQVDVCSADRCAVLGETSWTGTDISTCGDLPPLFDGFWDAAGEGSCSAPPHIAQDEDTYELIVTPQRARASTTSCSVSDAGRDHSARLVHGLGIALALIASRSLATRRRR